MKKIILTTAFLGLGIFSFAQTAQDTKADFKQKKIEHLQKMKEELNLTDSQVAQLKALHKQKVDEKKQGMMATKEDRIKMMKDNEAEMQKILTPDQYKKFQEMKAKKMEERKELYQKRKAAEAAVVK